MKLELSVIDSPTTPATPVSPVDISLAEKPLSLSQCESLARTVQKCSKSLIEGVWSDVPDVRGRRVKFIPSDFESAKAFLRESVVPNTVRRARRSLSDTPVTSRVQNQEDKSSKYLLRQNCLTMQRIMTCHGCHLVIGGGEHNGSAIGKDKCTLPHSDRCLGGIPESENWRACPFGYVSNVGYNVTGFSQTLGMGDFQSAEASTPVASNASTLQLQAPNLYQKSPYPSQVIVPSSHQFPVDACLRPELDDQLPQQAPLDLGLDQHGQVEQLVQHDPAEDLLKFRRQANGEGARKKVIHERMPSRISFVGDSREQQAVSFNQDIEQDVAHLRSHNQQASLVSRAPSVPQMTIGEIRSTPGMTERVEMQWSNIRGLTPALSSAPSAPPPGLTGGQAQLPFIATNQQQINQHSSGLSPNSSGTGMAGEGVDVQQQLADARSRYAAVLQQKKLADQQLNYQQRQSQIAAAQARDQADLLHYQQQIQQAEEHIKKTQQAFQNLSLGSGQVGVGQSQRSSVLRQATSQPGPGQAYTNPVVVPTRITAQPPQIQGYEVVIGADGRQYQVPRSQMCQVPEVEVVTGADGRRYQVSRSDLSEVTTPLHQATLSPQRQQLSLHRPVIIQQPTAGQVPQPYPWQHVSHGSVPTNQLHQNFPPHSGFNATTVAHSPHPAPAVGGGAGEQYGDQFGERIRGIVNVSGSEGVRKQNKLIDYVRRCPAKWCKQVKPTSMNMPVFGYGAVSELIESMTGKTDQLTETVLLAKLKHLRDVFEVCCINSTDTEFCEYGWTLARDYALKVQDKVDQQQHSWETHSGIQSDVLLSAQMEFPRPALKDPAKANGDKPLCTTYNKCTTEGKCDYEVSSGRACIRKHECSWCRKNKNKSNKHQETKCTLKVAAAGK